MKAELDSAATLVTICSRCTFNEQQRSDIRDILNRGVDWNRVLALAEKNYVVPLLFESLTGDLVDLVPEVVYRQLATQRKFLKFRAGLFCDELVRLSGVLESSHICVLHYKGPVSSESLYGDRYRRTYFDLDFLVKRDDLDGLSQLLRNEGYECTVDLKQDEKDQFEREQKEYAFVSGLVCVEPHWSVTARRYPFPIDYAGLWERAIVHHFGNTKLLTFSPQDMLIILSVVGAKGRWKRLQMVTDVAQFYRSMDESLAPQVLAYARTLGCERILLVAAHLAEILLDAPIPASILARIHEDRRAVQKISRRVIRQLFLPSRQQCMFGDSAHLFSPLLFMMRERRRDKITYLLQTTTTPTRAHFQKFPLPRWAYPVYRLIVPVHDYVLVPLVHAVRGRASP
jgi:Uncharacterised nucleotidyltransferase